MGNFWRNFVLNLMKKKKDRQTHKENSIPLSLSKRVYDTVTNRLGTCNWGTDDCYISDTSVAKIVFQVQQLIFYYFK